MDFEALKFWVDVAWKVGTVFGFVWLAVRQRHAISDVKVEALDERLDGHEVRLVRVEEKQTFGPSHQDLEQIHGRIGRVGDSVGDVRESVSGLIEAVNGLRRSVDTLNQHHLGSKP